MTALEWVDHGRGRFTTTTPDGRRLGIEATLGFSGQRVSGYEVYWITEIPVGQPDAGGEHWGILAYFRRRPNAFAYADEISDDPDWQYATPGGN